MRWEGGGLWGGGVQVADRFLYQAFEEGLPAALWVVQLDSRGASSLVHRCKQARPSPRTANQSQGLGGALCRGSAPWVGVLWLIMP